MRCLAAAFMVLAAIAPAAAQGPATPPPAAGQTPATGQPSGTDPALTSPAARGATLSRVGDELVSTRWRLVEMDGKKVPADQAPTLEFLRDLHIRGSTGCHRYVGPFASRADKGVFGPVRTGGGDCPPGVEVQEDRYLAELQRGWLVKVGEQKKELFVYMQAAQPPLRFVRLP